jgi:hypothetical protein
MAFSGPGRRKRFLRVKTPPEKVEEASRLAEQLAEEGCTQAEQLARVSTVVADDELGMAIVSCVESRRRSNQRYNHEPVLGIYIGALSLVLVVMLALVARWLFLWVRDAPNDALPAIVAACGQIILIRLSWRLLKFAGIALTDTLNRATYPTIHNQPLVTTPEEDAIRFDRIRLILAELVERLLAGSRGKRLFEELSRVEFTRAASTWLLIQAKVGVFIRANFPPYVNRTRAYVLATGAAFGCAIGIGLAHEHLMSLAHRDYLLTWALLFVLEFLRSPRPQESQEAA